MNEKINLQDLSALLAERTAITKKDAETFLREYFDLLNEELVNSGLIKIKDLGTFKLLQVEDRESVNVTTGERVLIPAHYKVAFTPDRKLAETVNEPFAFFETTEVDGEDDSEELQPLIEDDDTEELQPVIEEDASEESELNTEEEEEKEKDAELNTEEEENVVFEKEPEPEEKPAFIPETRPYQLNYQDYDAYRTYRKKYYNARKKLNAQKLIILILSLLLAAALGYIVYMTIPDKNILAPIFHKITTYFISTEKVVPEDSITLAATSADAIVPTDSVNPIDSIAPAEESAKPDTVVKTAPPVNSVESKQITISSGDRLSSIAQKAYGDKVFWIYIYLENKAIIRNPDVLPVGKTITIPPAAKYGIDCNNPASIQKAKDTVVRNP